MRRGKKKATVNQSLITDVKADTPLDPTHASDGEELDGVIDRTTHTVKGHRAKKRARIDTCEREKQRGRVVSIIIHGDTQRPRQPRVAPREIERRGRVGRVVAHARLEAERIDGTL